MSTEFATSPSFDLCFPAPSPPNCLSYTYRGSPVDTPHKKLMIDYISYDTSSPTTSNHESLKQLNDVAASLTQNSNSQIPQGKKLATVMEEEEAGVSHMVPSTSVQNIDPISSPRNQSSNSTTELIEETPNDFLSCPLAAPPHSTLLPSETDSCLATYVTLYLAALRGDWRTAEEFLIKSPGAVCAKITRGSETALHIAAGAKQSLFVEKLVGWMTPEQLALPNNVGNTALCFAAASGIIKIAAAMVKRNRNLPQIRGSKRATPLYMATLLGHRDMVWYLYDKTVAILTDGDRIGLLVAAITADLYDLALEIIRENPKIAIARDENGETALHVLARKPSAYYSGSHLGFWQKFIYSFLHVEVSDNFSGSTRNKNTSSPKFQVPNINVIRDQKLMHIQAIELVTRLWKEVLLLKDSDIRDLIRTPSRLLFTAAQLGIVEFLIVLIQSFPDLIWKVDDQSRSIFHIAVLHRREKVFNLIYEIGALKDLIASYKDANNNNMLHLAAKHASYCRLTDPGAALQLRRELHWFKVVKEIVQPLYREMRNSDGRTPQMLFSEEHKEILQEGEKWMKDTSTSCMVVATLIATVMFVAFITVPGGNVGQTGIPVFLNAKPFMVFAISDAISLVSSAASLLIFLSILTSRYAEEDFLHSLPNRLIIGLATLFISILTMMITFGATLFIVLGPGFPMIEVPIASVACIPVSLFALLQFHLFADMISHMYRARVCFCPSKHLLHQLLPKKTGPICYVTK